MPPPSAAEQAIYKALAGELRARGLGPVVEYTVNLSRNPLRYRQIDLAVALPSGIQMWVEIDGPNHKGADNKARDAELATVAETCGATLLHWPLWRVLHSGLAPLLEAVLRGDRHLGHAEPVDPVNGERYRVWDSRYSR